jgi:hypothetical protein
MSGGNRSGLLFDSSSGVKKLSKRQALDSSEQHLNEPLIGTIFRLQFASDSAKVSRLFVMV